MTETRTIRMSGGTKTALVAAIAVVSVCAIGAVLVIGRGGGGALQAASSGGAGPVAPRVSAGEQDEGGFAQLEACLAEHGVTLPDRPAPGTRIAPSAELRQAFETCRRYLPALPSGGRGGGRPGDGTRPATEAPPAGSPDDGDPSF